MFLFCLMMFCLCFVLLFFCLVSKGLLRGSCSVILNLGVSQANARKRSELILGKKGFWCFVFGGVGGGDGFWLNDRQSFVIFITIVEMF